MATLTLRLIKGSTLTFSETDNNFTALNNEKIERDGSIPFTGAQPFVAGTVSAPGITIAGDTNTGIYSPAADQLAITCGGTQRGLFSSSGLTVTGTISGTLSGDGSAITNLNANNIATGTLADARLSSNVPLKNTANTFTADMVVDAGPNNGITVKANASAQLWLNCTGAPANQGKWLLYSDLNSFKIKTYSDDLSSGSYALSIMRTGDTAYEIYTYHNLYVGVHQSSIGLSGLVIGDSSHSGRVVFHSPSNVRVGYIGNATTFGTGDNGTLPYVAGTHDFTGNVVIGTPSSGAALSVSTATPADWTSLSSDRIRVGGTTGATNESISVIGATRSELLLGGHANTSTTTHNTIKFISTRRSTTDENAAAVAYITNTLTDGSSTTGGGLIFATRPANGSTASRLEISADGNVTINTPASGYALTVNGSTTATGTINTSSQEISSGTGQAQDKWFKLHTQSRDVRLLLSQSTSNVTLHDQTGGFARWTSDTAGNFTAAGTVSGSSDARLKADVKTIEGALDKVSAMRGVSFRRTDTGQRGVGVIAQEVAEVVPEVVHEGANGYLSVAYGNMVGILIEAIKELRDEVLKLKAKCLF
jgi:hypothetical protein